MLRRLGENVSAFKSLKTNFVQEKDLAIFQNRIIMKGRIYLQKPNRMAWHVDEPVKYSVVITDKSIRQWMRTQTGSRRLLYPAIRFFRMC